MPKLFTLIFAVLALALAPFAGAQSPDAAPGSPNPMSPHSEQAPKAPDHFYRVTLRVLEFSPENKLVDTRTYTATMPTGPKGGHRPTSIRSGDRVRSGPGVQVSMFLETGVKIDLADADEVDHSLTLNITADIATTSVLPPASTENPLTRQIRWVSEITIPVGKPTVVFSSDNASDHGRTELEVTANLIR